MYYISLSLLLFLFVSELQRVDHLQTFAVLEEKYQS